MKLLATLLFVSLVFTGCDTSPIVNDKGETVIPQSEIPMEEIPAVQRLQSADNMRIKVYTFDGHEYVRFSPGSNTSWGSHKGDCKNPSHKCQCN